MSSYIVFEKHSVCFNQCYKIIDTDAFVHLLIKQKRVKEMLPGSEIFFIRQLNKMKFWRNYLSWIEDIFLLGNQPAYFINAFVYF